jgi:hypothetical protein
LLCRPKPLGRRINLDQKQVLHIKPLCGQRWAKWHMRRTNQGHPRRGFASLLYARPLRRTQGRQQQTPQVLGAVGLQYLTQTTHGPAPTRQLRIQQGMAGSYHATWAGMVGQGICAPDRVTPAPLIRRASKLIQNSRQNRQSHPTPHAFKTPLDTKYLYK